MNRKRIALVGAAAAVIVAGAGGIAVAGGAMDDDATEQPIEGPALEQATKAALEETGGGTVTGTEEGDEESRYEVEETRGDGSQVDVQLDEDFTVVGSEGDDESKSGDD